MGLCALLFSLKKGRCGGGGGFAPGVKRKNAPLERTVCTKRRREPKPALCLHPECEGEKKVEQKKV